MFTLKQLLAGTFIICLCLACYAAGWKQARNADAIWYERAYADGWYAGYSQAKNTFFFSVETNK